MFDWLKRCYGEGKIRLRAETDSGVYTVKVPYIGDIQTLDAEELVAMVKNRIFVETGKRVNKVVVEGVY